MRMNRKKLLPMIILGTGLLTAGYPTIADAWNRMHQTRAIDMYYEETASADALDVQKEYETALEYNRNLYESYSTGAYVVDTESYNETLSLSDNGVMGVIEIPSIDVCLPIFHGTDPEDLANGVGHVEGTSLPVGGDNTHAVLSGHTGLPSAKLFSDLYKIEEGDHFDLMVCNQTLTYEVESIKTVLPDQTSEFAIEPGRDLCTLVTCTPYGINTHRLLIKGSRYFYSEEQIQEKTPLRSEYGVIILISLIFISIFKSIRACVR